MICNPKLNCLESLRNKIHEKATNNGSKPRRLQLLEATVVRRMRIRRKDFCESSGCLSCLTLPLPMIPVEVRYRQTPSIDHKYF